MRKVMGLATVVALAFTAGVALADEVSGKIQSIDTSMKTLTVGDKTLQWSSENSMGVKLDELKEGDQVKVMFEANQNGHNDVMEITKEK